MISDSGGFFPSIFVAWEQPRIEGWQFKGEDRLFGELIKGSEFLGKAYGLHAASLDRRFLGAQGGGRTRLWSSSWFLYENLHLQGQGASVRSDNEESEEISD